MRNRNWGKKERNINMCQVKPKTVNLMGPLHDPVKVSVKGRDEVSTGVVFQRQFPQFFIKKCGTLSPSSDNTVRDISGHTFGKREGCIGDNVIYRG